MNLVKKVFAGLSVIFFFIIQSCEPVNHRLIVRGEMPEWLNAEPFDSVMLVSELSETDLTDAAHVLINVPSTTLTFQERNAIERYLEAGGYATLACEDTVYNWGQVKPFFENHQIKMACDKSSDLQQSRPDYSVVCTPLMPSFDRMKREVLVTPLAEPMAIVVTENSLVYWIERRGGIHTYNPATKEAKEITRMTVYDGHEDGLLGIALDPDFKHNQWAYIFYSPVGDSMQHISRFTLTPEGLDLSTEKIIIKVPVQRKECCHSAGDLEFDANGNLFISTGDNTFSRESDGFTPLDERPGRSPFDAQKSSGNTHDLRGKVLRIHPEKDGSYTIPDGNLFAKDGSEGRPEIYTMGARNPFTIAIRKDKDWLYWGDVGPDGNETSARGPSAHDEINFAKAPGNFGWPYFNANNIPYADFDFETREIGPLFDPVHPVNTSINNTGSKALPPAVPAMIYYTFVESPLFPGMGKGSRSAGVGEVYDLSAMKRHGYEFPEYYHHKLFAYDWARDWIMVVTQDEEGNFQSIEPFLDNKVLASPIDMTFGPDGALYVLEYGIGYFTNNHDSKLIRIDFVNGNRPPVVKMAVSPQSGKVPLEVTLSAFGTYDADEDSKLSYTWQITGPEEITITEPESIATLSQVGTYQITLTVSDEFGMKSSEKLQLTTGNTRPELDITFSGNQSFYWPGEVKYYQISVTDAEDGSLGSGINAEKVASFLTSYKGSDNRAPSSLAILDQLNTKEMPVGLQLISKSDCKSCHKINEKSIGPSFHQIADRYDKDYLSIRLLTGKILNGGTGNWGDGAMIAHPDISEKGAEEIVKYIFSVNDPKTDETRAIALSGEITPKDDQTKYRIEAAYTDAGGSAGSGPISVKKEITLRPPVLQAELADQINGFEIRGAVEDGDKRYLYKNGKSPYFKMEQIDLTDVREIQIKCFIPESNDSERDIEVILYADELGTHFIGSNWIKIQNHDIQLINIRIDQKGIHDLYLAMKSSDDAYLIGIDQITFIK